MLVAMLLLGAIVAGMVSSGARDANLSANLVEGAQAGFAAEAAANMAVKEIMDQVDRDGDGVIGSISNDSTTSTDPLLRGSRLWAISAGSGSSITVTAHGQAAGARRAVQADVIDTGEVPTAATVLLVVVNSSSLLTEELQRKSLIEGWGYAVTTISANASQAAFDAAAQSASVAYIVETCLSGDISTKLTNATIGVITEESSVSDELGFSASMTTLTATQVDIINTSHYITSTLAGGVTTLYSTGQPVRWLSGAQGGYTPLAHQVGTSNVMLAVMERGATLTPSGSAAGRRVYLPWGNTYFDMTTMSADALTIMKRSIQWCLLPIGVWRLNEGTGAALDDPIGGHDGTLVGPTWTTGRFGSALHFDGVNDYVTIADASAFQVTTALTIAGWIKAESWNYGDYTCIILRKGEANPNNWQLGVTDGHVSLTLDDYDAYGMRGNTTLSTGTWYHVAAAWDGSNVRLYVNGVLDHAPIARAAPIATDTRALYLGGRSGATDVTHGIVDEVRFYDRALTAAEIQALLTPRIKVTGWAAVAP